MTDVHFKKSAALLRQPLAETHALDDQLFILAEVMAAEDALYIDIAADTPTVTFDKPVAAQYGIPTVAEARAGRADARYSLVSGGCFLWIAQGAREGLVVLKRSIYIHDDPKKGEVAYPGYYTYPTGRCGELPSRTTLKEMNEEVLVLQDNVACLFSLSGETGMSEALKRAQVLEFSKANPDLAIDATRIQLVEVEPVSRDDLPIVTRIEGVEVDRFTANYFFDADSSTVEINRTVRAHFPEEAQLRFYNMEAPGRPVALYTADELAAEPKLLPSLKGYMQNHWGDFEPKSSRYIGPFSVKQRRS